MRVLLVGSGGREHAMAAAIARSPLLDALLVAPGNPGTARHGVNVPVAADDVAGLVALARRERIDLVVPGPEAPLVAGLGDACREAGIACAGPTTAAARLEGSKGFAKEVCDAAGIPTARWERFQDPEAAREFIRRRGAPIVVKADGLAAGKGVVVADTVAEAEAAVSAMLGDGSGADAGGASVVIEECLVGDEVSLFALCDGEHAVLLGAAQDHKRIGENDTGSNTGGMGAVSPPAFFDAKTQEVALDLLVRPALREMARRGIPFRGVIFAGLMLTENGPFLIEYNVRLGDPEAQVLIPRLRSDLLEALAALARGELARTSVRLGDEHAVAVVMAGRGYPGVPATGGAITGIERAEAADGTFVWQAATRLDTDGTLRGAGGRVLAVTGTGTSLMEARERAYVAVGEIGWADAVWRRDIGVRALAREAVAEGAAAGNGAT